jgi:hypothetical protein
MLFAERYSAAMPVGLVEQLHFARSEFRRGLADVNDDDGARRIGSTNSISWMVGHLAWQEERYWLRRARGVTLIPRLDEDFAYGKPATTPPLLEVWEVWDQVIVAADDWLLDLDLERLDQPLAEGFSNVGTFLYRNIYHYWYHLGEAMAVRQQLGHQNLADFVGDIDSQAPWRPDY